MSSHLLHAVIKKRIIFVLHVEFALCPHSRKVHLVVYVILYFVVTVV